MIEQEETFDARRYWEERLQAHPGITGVGYISRSPRFLEQQYRSRMRRVEVALHRYKLVNLAGCSVLDIGSSTGIWLDFWHRHGARHVAGLNFAQTGVDSLLGNLIVHKVRSVAEYQEMSEAEGFAIDSIWPATVLLSNPLKASNRLTFSSTLGVVESNWTMGALKAALRINWAWSDSCGSICLSTLLQR